MMTLLIVFGLTLGAFLLVVVGMAVGVLMGRRSISGSCGGLANAGNPEGDTSCSLCSSPATNCKELKERMRASAVSGQPGETAHSTPLDCEKDCEAEGCDKATIDACKGH